MKKINLTFNLSDQIKVLSFTAQRSTSQIVGIELSLKDKIMILPFDIGKKIFLSDFNENLNETKLLELAKQINVSLIQETEKSGSFF